MEHQLIVVVNLGGPQGAQVAQRVRECQVYCEVYPWNADPDFIASLKPRGIIITGGLVPVPDGRLERASWVNALSVPVLEIGLGTAVPAEALAGGAGKHCLDNFLKVTCECTGDWTPEGFINDTVDEITRTVGDSALLLGLSGGLCSSVAAALLSKALGHRLVCIYVDTGLMRLDETAEVTSVFGAMDMTFVSVNAESRFLFRLLGVSDPQQKRKIVAEELVAAYNNEAKNNPQIRYLAQASTYSDFILLPQSAAESPAASSLPQENGRFEGILQPLRCLFKSEVRKIGAMLGIPQFLLDRQSFPGAGLSIRCVGAITKERIDILREADAIFREEIEKAGLNKLADQFFAIITDTKTTGVRNERRTFEYTVALRAVRKAEGAAAAEWVDLPFDLLRSISRRITTEVANVNRVVYDITSNPPAAVEWE